MVIVPVATAQVGSSAKVGAAGAGLITIESALDCEQPVALFVTVSVLPAYVPAAANAGTTITMGEGGSAALTTLTKPCAIAAAVYVMLYWLGCWWLMYK